MSDAFQKINGQPFVWGATKTVLYFKFCETSFLNIGKRKIVR